MLLVVIQEDMEKISDIMDRLIVKRLILEEYIKTRIQRLVESREPGLKLQLPYPIDYITKKQLEEGYINLTSTNPDGEDHIGDCILLLTTGDIVRIGQEGSDKIPVKNALRYHGLDDLRWLKAFRSSIINTKK